MTTKVCSKCRSVLPVTEALWYFTHYKPKSCCKECQKKQDVLRRQTAHYRDQDRGRRNDPERAKRSKAGSKCREAVKEGRLYRPTSCAFCLRHGLVPEGHHHQGYAPRHWLHVTWLCRKCHRRVHEMMQAGVPVKRATETVRTRLAYEQMKMFDGRQ